MHISSQASAIQAQDAMVYALISNCKNLETMLPPQVENFKADENHCECNVAGMASLRLDIIEKIENRKVVYQISNDKQIPLTCTFAIASQINSCDLTVDIEAEIPLFLQSMLKNPLQRVADALVEKIKNSAESK